MVASVMAEMIRRLRSENQVSLKKASPLLQGRSYFTLRRYVVNGVRGGIRLEAYRLGREYVTSVEAIERFIAATTADQPPTQSVSAQPVAYASGSTERQLDSYGIRG
jgi:hypothetical protein